MLTATSNVRKREGNTVVIGYGIYQLIQTAIVLKRRAYASVPDENRLRNTLSEVIIDSLTYRILPYTLQILLTRQKGFAYQVIVCNKMCVRQEKLVTSTFGFLAVELGGKFVVVKVRLPSWLLYLCDVIQ